MAKKSLCFSITFLLLVVSLYLYNKYYGFTKSTDIPNFNYKNLKGLSVQKKNINLSKETVFIYFDTKCLSCKSEISHSRIFEKYKNANVLLVTSERNKEKVKKYINYEVIKKQNISLLFDLEDDFASDFKLGLKYDIPVYIHFEKNGVNKKNIFP